MFKQFIFYRCAERIENEINPLHGAPASPPGQNRCLRQSARSAPPVFVSQRSDINADLHIHALLLDVRHEVFSVSSEMFSLPVHSFFQHIPADLKFGVVVVEDAKTQRDFLFCFSSSRKRFHPFTLRRPRKIHRALQQRVIELFLNWRAVIIENAVKIVVPIAL